MLGEFRSWEEVFANFPDLDAPEVASYGQRKHTEASFNNRRASKVARRPDGWELIAEEWEDPTAFEVPPIKGWC